MNQHPENRDENVDEMHDRLIDQGLREVLGDQPPPDLCARILAAAAPAAGATAVAVAARPPQEPAAQRSDSRRSLKPLAVAAGLLIALGAGALLIRPWNAGEPHSAVVRTSDQQSDPGSGPAPLPQDPVYAGKPAPLSAPHVAEPSAPDSSLLTAASSSKPVQLEPPRDEELHWRGHLEGGPGLVGRQMTSRLGDHAPAYKELATERERYANDRQEFESSEANLSKRVDDDARLVPRSRFGLPERHREGYDRTITKLANGDAEYRSRVDKVRDLEQQLKATTQVAKDPNSPIVQMARQEVAKAQASADQRRTQIRERLALDLTDGQSVAINDKPLKDDSDSRDKWERDPQTRDEGRGPGEGGDRYRRIIENPFLEALSNPLSTFSIDVDTASYANVRQFLMQQKTLPPADAVRLEELINYFPYNYAGPEDARPFASHVEVAQCPWADGHKVVRVAIKGRDVADKRPRANLVFLIDVSGSMNEPAKLPLLVQGLKLLTEQLRSDDRVAMVVYAGHSGLVLPSTAGEGKETILAALDGLKAGGSTNGGAGINLAYKVAKENFIAGGINRVILCTDGDFNVGVTSDSSLERLVEEKAKEGTFLTVLGFGRGNFNDSMLEAISGKGNGNYAYVDNLAEARKVLVEQLSGTLMTIAKDVKIQIEFNPAKVAGYRLLGYEDRMLKAEDFNNDKKDAGEIGSGHTVTALYEIVPAGGAVPATKVDELRYQQPQKLSEAAATELLTLKIRYKEPTAEKSQLIEVPIRDEAKKFAAATSDFQFAAAVAGFGMLLRGSEHKGSLTYDAVLEIAAQHQGKDANGYRAELLEMIRRAKELAGK